MTHEEIKRNAPDGATHYRFDEYKVVEYFKHNDEWMDIWCPYEEYWPRSKIYHNDLKPL